MNEFKSEGRVLEIFSPTNATLGFTLTVTHHAEEDGDAYVISGFNPSGNGESLFVPIIFQKGAPLRDVLVDVVTHNGITMEALLAIVIDRLKLLQAGEYPHKCNEVALKKLESAMIDLHRRSEEVLGEDGKHLMREGALILWPGNVDTNYGIYLTKRDLIAEFIAGVIEGGGVTRAVTDVPRILSILKEHLTPEFFLADGARAVYGEGDTTCWDMSHGQLHDMLCGLVNLPGIAEVNLSQQEIDAGLTMETRGDDKIVFTDRYGPDTSESPANFIDLGALARNVTNALLLRHQLVQA